MSNFKISTLIFFYGSAVLEAKKLDELLKKISQNRFTKFNLNPMSDTAQDILQSLNHLLEDELIKAYQSGHETSYCITTKGRLKLANGGFIDDCKRGKNSLYAFYISVFALIISVISIALSIFD